MNIRDYLNKIIYGKKPLQLREETLALLNESKKKLDEVEVLQKKFESDNTLTIADSTKLLKNLKTKSQEIKDGSKIIDERLAHLRREIDKRFLWLSAINPLITFMGLIIINIPPPTHHHTSINMNFYITLAQVIPVFMIAWSVNEWARIESSLEYLSAVIGFSPAIAAEIACLYAIEINKSLSWTFYIASSGALQALFYFILSGIYLVQNNKVRANQN